MPAARPALTEPAFDIATRILGSPGGDGEGRLTMGDGPPIGGGVATHRQFAVNAVPCRNFGGRPNTGGLWSTDVGSMVKRRSPGPAWYRR